jgi:hypothetical protein
MTECDCEVVDAIECYARKYGISYEEALDEGLACECVCHQEKEESE